MMDKISIVVSVYNEEQVIDSFWQAFCDEMHQLSVNWELIFVNDGSFDHSCEMLKNLALIDSRVKLVNFSRNFGHEAAMIAGIDFSNGDGVICMDVDLQHPVTCIPEIMAKLKDGYEVITMIRKSNKSAGLVKNVASSAFYRIINVLSDNVSFQEGASDFFAISRRVAELLKTSYREKNRFLRGYIQSVGFRSTSIEYEAASRAAGASHYGLSKLFSLSANAIVGFSSVPLRLGVYTGLGCALLGLAVLIYTLVTHEGSPSGYATIVVLLCFLFAMLFVVVGIIGQYLAVLFSEVKDRPIYLVESTINIGE